MKKIFLFAFLISISFSSASFADNLDGHTSQGAWAREGVVLGRGLAGIPGTVWEVFATPIREHNIHPKAWPLTGLIRIPTNVFARAASFANDLVVYPWMVPFTDDISPITESFDLPEYAWQS